MQVSRPERRRNITTELAIAGPAFFPNEQFTSWLAIAMSCWQSAPADIICDIGERLLDSNDLDGYVAMRGVCFVWRQAIAPPIEGDKHGDTGILRVRPHQWIVLEDEITNEIVEVNDEGVDRVLVNLSTGRMVKRHFSIFNDHIFAGSSDGLLILVQKNEPCLVKLWEPFTGYHVQFSAGIVNEQRCRFAVETRGVPRLFAALGDYAGLKIMCYDIDNGCLEVPFDHKPGLGVVSMTTYKSDVFVLFQDRQLFKITGTGRAVHGELILIHRAPDKAPIMMKQYLVVSRGNLLLVIIGIIQVLICRVDVEQRTTKGVYNLGRHALFLSDKRCISVIAENFSAVRQNCLYVACGQYRMCEYGLVRPRKQLVRGTFIIDMPYDLGTRPFSMLQILMHYCLFQDRRKRQLL